MNTLPVLAANAPSALDARGASLLVRPDIFRADTRSLELTSGVSILAAVRQAMRQSGLKIPLRMIEIYAAANEHSPLAKVPREHWHTRLVKHGEFLQVVVAVRGGGGGGKNPLRTILSIVVVVVAAIASVYCPPLLGFTAGTIGASIAGAVAGAVVMMGGMLLVNAIAPMSTPKLGSASNLNAERIWSVDGIQNRFDPYGKVPLVLGKVRFAPRFAASPYTYLKGDKQFARYLFAVAGRNRVSDLRIGDTALDNFKGVTSKVWENWVGQPLALFPKAIFQEDMSVILSNASGNHSRSSLQDCVETQFELFFNGGLGKIDKKGRLRQASVEFAAHYRKDGGAWQPFFDSAHTAGGTLDVLKALGFGVIRDREGTLNVYIAKDGGVTFDAVYKTSGSWSGYDHIGTVKWKLHPETGIQLTAEKVGSSNISLQVNDKKLVVSAGTLRREKFTVARSTITPFRLGYSKTWPEKGQYEVRLRRLTADSNKDSVSESVRDEVVWSCFRSIQDGKVLDYQGAPLTLIELEVQATEQLNGHLQEFNCILESYAPTWNGKAWVDAPTSNPASLCMLISASPHVRRRIDQANRFGGIYLPAWQGFYDWCREQGWTYDAVLTSQESVREVVHNILSAARGAIAFKDTDLSVAWDHPGKRTVYPLGPRNSWGFRSTRAFTKDELHGLRVRFLNNKRDFQEDERIVYNDGYSAQNATNIVEAEFDGVTDPDTIWKLARLRMADSVWRPETYELNVDYSFLAFDKGDRVEVTHYVPMWGLCQARIIGLESNLEGQVTAVRVDDTVSLEPGKRYAFKHFISGSRSAVYNVDESLHGTGNLLRLAVPVPESAAPELDGLIHFGEAGKETHDCIVTGIDTQDNLCARVTLQDYSVEQIYKALTGKIPAWDSDISLPSRWQLNKPKTPTISGIATDESVLRKAQNILIPRIQVSFYQPESAGVNVRSVHLQIRKKDSPVWEEAGAASPGAGYVYAENVEEGVEYELRLYAMSSLDLPSEYSPVRATRVIGRTTPPPPPLTVHMEGTRLWWEMPGDYPLDVRGWEVLMGFDETDSVDYARPLVSPYTPVMEFDVANWSGWARRVFVRTVDDIGLKSTPVSVGINLGAPLTDNVVLELRENADHGWPGKVENGYVSATSGRIYPDSTEQPWKRVKFWQGQDFWGGSSTVGMSYQRVHMIGEQERGSYLQLKPDMPLGRLAAVEYRFGRGTDFWNRGNFWQNGQFWGWEAVCDWQPMPSKLSIDDDDILEVRVSSAAGSSGRLDELTWVFDVEDEMERVDNLPVEAGGTRIPLQKVYRWIKNISFGLEYHQGSLATRVVWLDKGITEGGLIVQGPLIRCFDANNAPVPGIVDVTVQGAKGVK